MQRKLLGIISVDFEVTGQLLIIYFAFIKYLRKNGNTMRQCISYLWTSRKPMIQLGGGVMYNILIEFGIPMKVVSLIKMCLNETCWSVCVGKHFSAKFPFKNSLKQGDAV